MTQEEKARAYDEALEKARMYRDNAKAVEDYSAAARYENIFPQLRESEDERIRQAILAEYKERLELETLAYKNPECNKDTVSFLEKAVAYLEKQKEQKPAEWSEEDERILERAIHIIVEYSDIDEKESEIVQNWLKSLRPSWKPSEELLDALYIVAYLPELEFYGGLKDKIRELYKRLKKL